MASIDPLGGKLRVYSAVLLSFIVAFMLSLLPLSIFYASIAPQWVTLAVIYWVLRKPYWFNVKMVWCVGFLVDALTGSLLGLHGFGLVVVACAVSHFGVRIMMFHVVQQMAIVALLCWLNVLLVTLFNYLFSQPSYSGYWWLSPVLSAIIWLGLSVQRKKEYARY
jgi:rod shape-determining protein MreD